MRAQHQSQTTIRVATRGSALAVTQTRWVVNQLEALHPGLHFELVTIRTKGDERRDVSLNKLGDKGLFVKELEESLLSGHTDVAVHSAKDLPGQLPPGLTLGAFPPSEDPRDVLVCRGAGGLSELPDGARIGTSSLRRTAQLLHYNPSFKIVPIRGNIDTRLRKLETEKLDAVVLAAAGLHRMQWQNRVTEYLDPLEVSVPAAGQGVLAIECRSGDERILEVLAKLDHADTRCRVAAERAFLRRLEGGCQVPMGGYARLESGKLEFVGVVAATGGKPFLRVRLTGNPEEAAALGQSAAEKLLEMGAAELVRSARRPEVDVDE